MPPPLEVSSNWKSLSKFVSRKAATASTKNTAADTLSSAGTSREVSTSGDREELWFDVDEHTLRRSQAEIKKATTGVVRIIDLFPSAPPGSHHLVDGGKYVAMDCEMVGVGPEGVESALARVSLVNYHGAVLLDTFVKPVERITDYRTHVSGVEPHHLVDAPTLASVQQRVWELIQGKILVGHSLRNDFRVLFIEHPRRMTRDTSKYRPFRRISRGKNPSLKRLAKEVLGVDIQGGAHDSVDDARVAMLLYRAHKVDWENYLFRDEGKIFKAQRRQKKAAHKIAE